MEQNPAVLKGKNEGIINNGKQGTEGDSKADGENPYGNTGTPQFYNWLSLIRAVSDLTKWEFDKVLQRTAVEFFAFASFVIYEKEREKKMIEDFRRGIKH